jgi:eukaryotic-like serine/threonine-protein kinase
MFELLTGSPPFTGETSLAVAYQHLSAMVPSPSSIVPGLPRALDRAVTGATDRDRTRRPQSARAMAKELTRAAQDVEGAPPVAELARQIPAAEVVPEERATTVTIPRVVSPRAKRARRLRLAGAFLLVLMVLAAGAAAAWVYAVPHYTHVPRVQGLTVEQAEQRLRTAGLDVRTGPGQFSSTVEAGLVIESRPPPGTKVRKDAAVILVPSLGPELKEVPNVRGKKEATAKKAIDEAGFKVRVTQVFDDEVGKGRVIRQSPDPGVEIEKGKTVTITVSKGPAPVPIPPVAGKTREEAKATLEALGFTVTITERFSETVAKGTAIETDPPAGNKVNKGSDVMLVVSKGPESFKMPDVVGMKTDAAKKKLQDLGLRVQVHKLGGPYNGSVVVLQSPDEGAVLHRGDTVELWV